VAALRDDLPPLDERLRKLCAERGVIPQVIGEVRPLPADISLTLYRAAQEAMTNVIRHAPGVTPLVSLTFGPGEVALLVTNSPSATPATATPGGGYGLQGLRERVLLLGGTVEAGPSGGSVDRHSGGFGGWRVEVRIPLAASA
jgi:signal transduction histidine kinase